MPSIHNGESVDKTCLLALDRECVCICDAVIAAGNVCVLDTLIGEREVCGICVPAHDRHYVGHIHKAVYICIAGEIYCARKDSPMIIGINGYQVDSELNVNAINEFLYKAINKLKL